mgnify:CR=1 FL=1
MRSQRPLVAAVGESPPHLPEFQIHGIEVSDGGDL